MDKALKQRLVGAGVLIVLAVVILPMLLGGAPEGQQETRSIEVPPKPSELSFETRRFPVGNQGNDKPSVIKPTTPAEPEPEPPVSAPIPESEPQAISTEATAVAIKPLQTPQAATQAAVPDADNNAPGQVSGRYLVQVASFSTTRNANNLAERLRLDSLPVLMDTIESAAGILHRVRVGPFDELAAAQSAMNLIRTQVPDVVNPRVIDLRPDESAPVTDPSDPLVRWVIQLGSFADMGNAENLVMELKKAGFSAYQVKESDSTGTGYKVRVGPEIERQEAVRIAAEIQQKLGHDGIVMSVD